MDPSYAKRARYFTACLLLALLALPLPTKAQDLGIVAGLNYGAIEDLDLGDVRTTYEERSGYHIGLYLDLDLGPIAVRPGVRYIDAGSLFEGLSEAVNHESGGEMEEGLDSFNMNMVVVPVDLRLELPLPLIQPYAFVGPEMRFARASSTQSELTNDLRDNELAGNIGAGAKIKIPGTGMTLSPEARYTVSLTGLMGEAVTVAGHSFETAGARKVNLFFLSLGLEF